MSNLTNALIEAAMLRASQWDEDPVYEDDGDTRTPAELARDYGTRGNSRKPNTRHIGGLG